MPKSSKATASQVADLGILETRTEELGDGYLVEFSEFREDADATPFLRGSRAIAASAITGATSSPER